jgi:Rad3-related DNA helicase
LSDPAVDHKRQQRPEWYQWSAVRDILQAYGRVCRGPDDYGVTYCLDSNWEMLYSKNRRLFPQWFREAVQ